MPMPCAGDPDGQVPHLSLRQRLAVFLHRLHLQRARTRCGGLPLRHRAQQGLVERGCKVILVHPECCTGGTSSVPAGPPNNQVDQLFRAQLFHDRKQYEERRRMSPEDRAKSAPVDYLMLSCAGLWVAGQWGAWGMGQV